MVYLTYMVYADIVEQVHTERSMTVVIWISGAKFVRPIAQGVIGCRRNAENSEYIYLGRCELIYCFLLFQRNRSTGERKGEGREQQKSKAFTVH